MTGMKAELVDLSDGVWQRLRGRLDGLTDDEYSWEPAPGCWTVRTRDDGIVAHDFSLPAPDPTPPTTIAWRLSHVIDLYGEDRAPQWLDVEPQGAPVGLDDPAWAPPVTAAAAIALLERAHDRWDGHLRLVDEAALGEKVGPVGGPFADRTRAAYVLHMLDEFIHHGAEIALLRDLWGWQGQLNPDPTAERVMRGDRTVVGDLAATDAAAELVDLAAAYGRWDLLRDLIEVGSPVEGGGTTPLHRAAGSGELPMVEFLVERGADPEARDPTFDATPADWARFLHHDDVAAWLADHTPG